VLLGRMLERVGRQAEAEVELRKAVELQPALAEVHVELADHLLAVGEAKAAVQALQAGLGRIPGSPRLTLRLAEAYRQAGDPESAIKAYEKILVSRPNDAVSANNLANVLLDTRRDRKSLERALALAERFEKSSNPAFLDTLGWARVKLGQPALALPLLRKAAEEGSGVPVFHYHLGVALHDVGDMDAAKQQLRKSLDTKSDFPGKDEARSLLAKG